MEKIYKIYKLIDPITDEVRYIGVTSRRLNQRLSQHKYSALTKKSELHVHRWFRKLYESFKILPRIELIEECSQVEWEEREKHWIKLYKNLTNIDKGGKGVVIERSTNSIERSAKGHNKPIVQLDDNYNFIKRWNSIKEASIYYNAKGLSRIGNCLRGIIDRSFGFIWIYEEEWINKTYNINRKPSKSRKVYQYSKEGELINSYNSLDEAIKIIGILYSSSLSSALSKNGLCSNYLWSYDKDYKDFKIKRFYKLKNNFEVEKIFYSYKEIADFYQKDYKKVFAKFNNTRQNKQFKESGLLYIYDSYWKITMDNLTNQK